MALTSLLTVSVLWETPSVGEGLLSTTRESGLRLIGRGGGVGSVREISVRTWTSDSVRMRERRRSLLAWMRSSSVGSHGSLLLLLLSLLGLLLLLLRSTENLLPLRTPVRNRALTVWNRTPHEGRGLTEKTWRTRST